MHACVILTTQNWDNSNYFGAEGFNIVSGMYCWGWKWLTR